MMGGEIHSVTRGLVDVKCWIEHRTTRRKQDCTRNNGSDMTTKEQRRGRVSLVWTEVAHRGAGFRGAYPGWAPALSLRRLASIGERCRSCWRRGWVFTRTSGATLDRSYTGDEGSVVGWLERQVDDAPGVDVAGACEASAALVSGAATLSSALRFLLAVVGDSDDGADISVRRGVNTR